MSMEAIGEQLRAARTKLGLTPAAAAARLHLRTSFVEAMEREDWHALGAPVYARGFLRNYAKLVGLDPQPLLERLPEEQRVAAPSEEWPAIANLGAGIPDRSIRTAKWYPWVLGALTVISAFMVVQVGIGIVGLVFFQNKNASAGNPTQAPTIAQLVPSMSSSSNTLQASAAAQSSNGVNVRLQLTQPSWLSVTVDGKRVVYETLPAGTVRTFHGAREITLRAGNAGGVVANFDGKDLGTLGTAGQVQDRVFAAKTPPDQLTGAHE
jgi:cytoskeletal protein RodZ